MTSAVFVDGILTVGDALFDATHSRLLARMTATMMVVAATSSEQDRNSNASRMRPKE